MAVLEELGSKLTDISGIKVSFPLPNDKDIILKIYSRLCLLYDETWDCGDASYPLSCKKILRLLNRVGIAHLTPTAADVTDPRRLPRVWSAFVTHLEQKYGGQGLYPRLRKVLKQQQILAARRDAERERQQRMAGSARSPGKPQLADTSCCSALSKDSQEDVRFAEPRPPLQKIRHLSASSSGSTVSPTKACGRSRIPVATRPNLIPTGKQLARTPSLLAKGAPPPPPPASSHGAPTIVRVFGSPFLVAPKAAAAPVPSPPRDRSDSVASESTSSTDTSPNRRRSLIPAAKTPEQALGEYIENRLNDGFPHSTDAAQEAPTEADTSPALPTAAAETTLNVTYSSERPAGALRATEKGSSPAADAREAILQAAGDAEDKENVRPAEVEAPVSAKPAGKAEETPTVTDGVRRDTFEVPPTPAKAADQADPAEPTAQPAAAQDRPREEREPSGGVPIAAAKEPALAVETCRPDAAHKSRDKKDASKRRTKKSAKSTAATASASEVSTDKTVADAAASEAASATSVHHADPAPTESVQESVLTLSEETAPAPSEEPASISSEEPVSVSSEGPASASSDKPASASLQEPASAPSEEPAPVPSAEPASASSEEPAPVPLAEPASAPSEEPAPSPSEEFASAPSEEPAKKSRGRPKKGAETANKAQVEPPKKRGGRAKKAKQTIDDQTPADVGVAPARDAPDTEMVTDQPVSEVDQPETTESAPSEAHHEQGPAPAEEAPKKRRGKAKKESKKAIDEAVAGAEAAVHVPTNDAVQPEVPDSAEVELAQEPTPVPTKEHPKKRRGRAKKQDKLVTEEVQNVPANSEDVPVVEEAQSAAEPCVDQTELRDSEPAETLQAPVREASKKRRGRGKEAKPVSDEVAAAKDTAPAAEAVSQTGTEEPELAVEPAGPGSRLARASRRKTAARPQRSTDGESDAADPEWVPDESFTGTGTSSRRGGRAAVKVPQPAAASEETAPSEADPSATRGRGRRTRHAAEPSETPAEESVEPDVPSGARAGRATRASRASTAADHTATAARRSTRGGRKTPDLPSDDSEETAASEPAPGRTTAPAEAAAAEQAAPRRRRLRVVLESDSEGGTPPAPERVEAAPSPAPLQRSRRGRKTKTTEDVSRPRRALRALENCD